MIHISAVLLSKKFLKNLDQELRKLLCTKAELSALRKKKSAALEEDNHNEPVFDVLSPNEGTVKLDEDELMTGQKLKSLSSFDDPSNEERELMNLIENQSNKDFKQLASSCFRNEKYPESAFWMFLYTKTEEVPSGQMFIENALNKAGKLWHSFPSFLENSYRMRTLKISSTWKEIERLWLLQCKTNINAKSARLDKCSTYTYISGIQFDSVHDKSILAHVTVKLTAYDNRKILLFPIIEEILRETFVRDIKGIEDCYAVHKVIEKGKKEWIVQTKGINLSAIRKYGSIADLNRIQANCIHTILSTYGVEAARMSIINEVRGVFNVYGIKINPRHLGLVGDYMTFEGGYKALNRIGIKNATSPLQRISFETSSSFLFDACLNGDVDWLSSPSAKICLGQPISMGTGSFELLLPLVYK